MTVSANLRPDLKTVIELMEVAQGKRPAEAYIAGGQVLNVYSGEVLSQNIAIHRGRIAYVGVQETMVGPHTRVIDASGFYLTPGYVNAHEHGDVLSTPSVLAQEMLRRGTTTIFFNGRQVPFLLGYQEYGRLIDEMTGLPVKLLWGIETGMGIHGLPSGGMADEGAVRGLLARDRIFGLHEVVRWTDVIAGDPVLLQTIAITRLHNKRVEGHTAGASYDKLNAVVAGGVHSCHESISLQEVLNRLRLGLFVMLRCSSIRPDDLPDMLRAITEIGVNTSRLALVPDGLVPADVLEKGNMDYLVAMALAAGVDSMTAYRMATLNPATYFGLDGEVGGIAPRRWADILFLRELTEPTPIRVMCNGEIVAEEGRLLVEFPKPQYYDLFPNKLAESDTPPHLEPAIFRVPIRDEPTFPVIEMVSSVINRRLDLALPSRDGFLSADPGAGILYLAFVALGAGKITRGFLKGFGAEIGGLAGTAGGSNNLIVLGHDPAQMALAANRVIQLRGGIVVVDGGSVKFEMPLPVGGVMSPESLPLVAQKTHELARLLKGMGFPFGELHYTLGTLIWYFLPQLRLTPDGILDVRTGQIVVPSSPL